MAVFFLSLRIPQKQGRKESCPLGPDLCFYSSYAFFSAS